MIQVSKEDYAQKVKRASPPSPKFKNLLAAFGVGGGICALGQALFSVYFALGASESVARILVSVTLIFLAVLLTGLHLFEKIAHFAGAGTLVPITGFANAVASPTVEFKNEGFVLGVGVKMFTIAGPVILYGTVAGVLYGVFYYFWKVMGWG